MHKYWFNIFIVCGKLPMSTEINLSDFQFSTDIQTGPQLTTNCILFE